MRWLVKQASGRSRRDCLVLIHRCAQEQPRRRSWSDEEIDQVSELLIANPVESVASKIGRSTSSVRQLCGRLGIRVRELRCDLFSVTVLLQPCMYGRQKFAIGSSKDGWRQRGRI